MFSLGCASLDCLRVHNCKLAHSISRWLNCNTMTFLGGGPGTDFVSVHVIYPVNIVQLRDVINPRTNSFCVYMI